MNESISLSELNFNVSNLIKEGFDYVWVTAEIQKLTENRFSGHCYLDLVEKDEAGDKITAVAKATIWRNKYGEVKDYFEQSTGMGFAAGLKVMLYVKPVFSEVYGYSLNVADIEPAYSLGKVAAERERTIQRLKEENVFDLNRQCPIPSIIRRIALITSPTAAGREDFLRQLYESPYKFEVRTFAALMQGEGAEASIIEVLDEVAAEVSSFDVVVLVRGGGAVSDLQCFDSYRLAFYCAQFPLPVVTGIGHDRDVSVLDMVAACPMKTPTAAAQFIIDRADISVKRLENLYCGLFQSADLCMRRAADRLSPLDDKLEYAVGLMLHRAEVRVDMAGAALIPAALSLLRNISDKIEILSKDVELRDPALILARGYCFVTKNGESVTASNLCSGNDVCLHFADGEINAVISD